jgi:hypothetical protein
MARNVSCCGIRGDVLVRRSGYCGDAVHGCKAFNHRSRSPGANPHIICYFHDCDVAGAAIQMIEEQQVLRDVSAMNGNEA